MKNSRQKKILELIELYDIDTQETLIERLSEVGISVTQTTISRDIRELKLVKGMTGKGTYKYIVPGVKKENNTPVLNSALTDAVIKIEAAKNIVVIKTFPGMANALCVCVDTLEHPHIVGSVAGDDTVLLVIKDDETAQMVEEKLKGVFGVK
ncbi:MAG: arginine repressor [Ruminococcaceae bacterium]|nr:arginine repressor [Oscillospiraceae bacterium]